MQNQLLLLEDIVNVGRAGEVVTVKPGFARNFLLPQKKAVVASKQTVKLQERLQEERAKKAAVDKENAEKLAAEIALLEIGTEVKVDAEGRMYGSVAIVDIVKICEQHGLTVDKKHVLLAHPIKTTGIHKVQLRLAEGVIGFLQINVYGDRVIQKKEEAPVEAPSTENQPES